MINSRGRIGIYACLYLLPELISSIKFSATFSFFIFIVVHSRSSNSITVIPSVQFMHCYYVETILFIEILTICQLFLGVHFLLIILIAMFEILFRIVNFLMLAVQSEQQSSFVGNFAVLHITAADTLQYLEAFEQGISNFY